MTSELTRRTVLAGAAAGAAATALSSTIGSMAAVAGTPTQAISSKQQSMEGKMAREYPPLEFGPTGDELTSVRFSDYEKVGEKLIEWAKNGPGSWPKDMDELRRELAGLATFPPQVKRLTVVQSYDSADGNFEFILRLPAKGQVSESERLAEAGLYEQPPVIRFLNAKQDESGNPLTPLQQFHARVADYTMRQCR